MSKQLGTLGYRAAWPERHLSDAESSFAQLPDGRLKLTVKHKPLQGVSLEMLQWWFGVYATLSVETKSGAEQAYRLWHPQDHICIQRQDGRTNKALDPGDVVVVEEAFGADPNYHIREQLSVLRRELDVYEVQIHRSWLKVARLGYHFAPSDAGALVTTSLQIGESYGWRRLLINNFLVPFVFDMQKFEAWMQHSVDEVGALEHFLPQLYAQRDKVGLLQWPLETPFEV